jgi:hypothetical protein
MSFEGAWWTRVRSIARNRAGETAVAAREVLGDDTFEREWREGAALSKEEALAHALSID